MLQELITSYGEHAAAAATLGPLGLYAWKARRRVLRRALQQWQEELCALSEILDDLYVPSVEMDWMMRVLIKVTDKIQRKVEVL